MYEAFAGRQTIAEWHKLKVCDLDGVQGSACGACAKVLTFAATAIKKASLVGLVFWWTCRGAVYEAFAGRQTIAEWHKLKVCDLDGVQGSACGACAKVLTFAATAIKKASLVGLVFWWTCRGSNPGPID